MKYPLFHHLIWALDEWTVNNIATYYRGKFVKIVMHEIPGQMNMPNII